MLRGTRSDLRWALVATGICQRCGKSVRWSARRGSTIADARCPCGGSLRGVSHPSATKGTTLATCMVCGKPRARLRTLTEPARLRFPGLVRGPAGERLDPGAVYPAGTVLCATHETESADPTARFMAHRDGCGARVDADTGYGFRRLPVLPTCGTRCVERQPETWTPTAIEASWMRGPATDAERFGLCEQEACPQLRAAETHRAT